ncbi:MAG: dehydrogenase [Bacteroidales bacterium]|nr:dehydrogenase [Bacteroidales bacterium]
MKQIILFLLPLLLVFSCTNQPQQPIVEPAPEPVVVDTIPEVPVLKPFPDTVLASAEKLLVQIDTIDKTLPSELSSLEDVYTNKPGIFTFRGSASRIPNYCGHLSDDSIQIKVDWAFTTRMDPTPTSVGVFEGGSGWTGQPLFVNWPDSIVEQFKSNPDSVCRNLHNKEIILTSLCGDLYFIDFETGEKSRPCHNIGNVLKGTPALNADLNGHVYIGHGAPKEAAFGTQVFDLFSHKMINTFGRDPKAWRGWGGYDSSPVQAGGFLFRPAENGTLYKYYVGDGGYTLQSTLRYSTTQAKNSPGMESSMAVCRNYGYVGDNAGNILCINLNTLKPVWHYWNHDDTDASPIVEEENGIPYVYTGCEVDHQGNSGYCYFVKLNGLTGELVWEDTIPCRKLHFGDNTSDGGMYVTPLIGGGDCEGMIFSAFCLHNAQAAGVFMAFDKNDGRELYRTKLKQYCWSSPVAFYNDRNEMFAFTGDVSGNVYLIKGKTGEIVATAKIGTNFEASPIVVDNKIIVGSRGNKIYKISLQ